MDGLFIIFNAKDSLVVNALRRRNWPVVGAVRGSCIAKCEMRDGKTVAQELVDDGIEVSFRLLDHFHFAHDPAKPFEESELPSALFDHIANDYEEIVDTNRNRENVLQLLKLCSQEYVKQDAAAILDFGCGTGLSLGVARQFGVEVIGVDPCQGMREIAAQRGMEVYGIEWLRPENERIPERVFASYVLHLLVSPHTLYQMWQSLHWGALFVGNFHKGRNMDRVNSWLTGRGAKVREITVDSEFRHHGTYVQYKKEN